MGNVVTRVGLSLKCTLLRASEDTLKRELQRAPCPARAPGAPNYHSINYCRFFSVVITLRRDDMTSRRSVTTTILATLISRTVLTGLFPVLK